MRIGPNLALTEMLFSRHPLLFGNNVIKLLTHVSCIQHARPRTMDLSSRPKDIAFHL
jgi:hypothetical protein